MTSLAGDSTSQPSARGVNVEGRPAVRAVPWPSLLALSAGHFAVDCCSGIWPVYKTLASLDLAKAGLIATAGSMVGNGLQILFGLLADRGWRKPLLLASPVLAGAVTLLPWVRSYDLMFGLVLATAVGSAAYHPSATGAAGALSRTRTGFLVGIFLAGGYVGYSLSQILFSAIHETSPALTPTLLVIPVAAVIGIGTFVPTASAGTGVARPTLRSVTPHARALAALFLVQVFATAINLALIFLLPDLLLARGAPGWMVRGGGHFALVAGGCLSLLPAGHASDRWGARRALLTANLATGVLLALLLGRQGASPVDLALVAAFGACNGINNVVAVSEGHRTMPGQGSAASALLMGMPWCVAAISPVLAGVLADPSRGGTPARALWSLGVAIPLALAASVFVASPGRSAESS
jgi:MFS transporter, FSR family, fosmidomycin resistance protein